MAVNLSGTFNILRHFAPPMVERQSGIFVNF
jgi:NADP-dependent 3-hydroxy acid dehydrogenase YdfG